ncbi:glycosyltransferase [Telluria beijingensis]|uniref:glycosyltransferase n=1 Tax=Telluria beijingensis TaxID=3068633 RepID=UPI002795445B|nr:glycosyltransferase [Massilia sp. REN29]
MNVDPMRIAWLLRADLRRGSPADGPVSDWFKMWWLIHGSREYPAWADQAVLREAGLFQPEPDRPAYDGFGMTSALRFLLDTREDLSSTFDVNTDEGLKHAVAWLFVHGVREHRLASAIDRCTLDALDAPPSFLVDGVPSADAKTPGLTWLMFFVWRTSADLQTHFDLAQAKDRQAYLIWFLFNGVPQLKLAPLVAARWHAWLHEPVLETPGKAAVPRAAYMLWQQHEQLQRAFDLQTHRGIAGLAMWSREVWRDQAELSWIGQPSMPLEQPVAAASQRPFGVNLIGFAFGELGIGEDVRMAAEACEAAGIPFAVVNIKPGDALRQADQALAAHVAKGEQQADEAPYAFNLFCLTAFDTARVYLERGRKLFEGRYNIGWWPWELPVWPSDWMFVFDLVDEVWAATNYTYQMYDKAASAAKSSAKVVLMSMPASVARVKPMTREELALPPSKFLFLYVFDFNSYLARKNPFAAVKAFRKAFNITDDNVGLVLKTMNSNPRNPLWLNFLRECAKDPRIIVLDKTMERGEVLGLIKSCDAYVSLHRAEGLGRTLAEAMLFGKAVIATDFSGSTDFLTKQSGFPVRWKRLPVKEGEYAFVGPSDHPWWADASIVDAAHRLRQARFLRNDIDFAPHAEDFFSPTRIGALMEHRLLEARAGKFGK